jgi:hypothetical protein
MEPTLELDVIDVLLAEAARALAAKDAYLHGDRGNVPWSRREADRIVQELSDANEAVRDWYVTNGPALVAIARQAQ